jgi:hypothetical protein
MRCMMLIAMIVLTTPALAGFDSAYTDFVPEHCKQIRPGATEGGYTKDNEKARWLADTAAEVFANAGTVTEGITSGTGCE